MEVEDQICAESVQSLINHLRNEDSQVRLSSMERLTYIARSIGSVKTRKELIPLLVALNEDEDEVLEAMARSLGDFVPLVGGSEHGRVLLGPLEEFCRSDEPSVRDCAVASLEKIARALPSDVIDTDFLEIVRSLATDKLEGVTSKVSAAKLLPIAYELSAPLRQSELCDLFLRLASDETAMVRRAAATVFGRLAQLFGPDVMRSAPLMGALIALAGDEQDSVRILAVPAVVDVAGLFAPEVARELLLGTVSGLAHDGSWRVRYSAADCYVRLTRALCGGDKVVARDEMLCAFLEFLRDSEAEVRTVAASRLAEFAELVPAQDVAEKLLPCAQELVRDQNKHVREALALVVTGIAPILGPGDYSATIVDSVVKPLLADETPAVRLNIIKSLKMVSGVTGIDAVSQALLEPITLLARNEQWRVRLSVIELIPALAAELGVEFFNAKLAALSLYWLNDSVFAIRDAAVKNLRGLTEIFGVEWAKEAIIPSVLAFTSHQNYLYRMTALFAISELSPVVTAEIVVETFLPTVIAFASDPVANVRFNAAKTLQVMAPLVTDQVLETKIKPCLNVLVSDSDRDVKFYATKCLDVCNGSK